VTYTLITAYVRSLNVSYRKLRFFRICLSVDHAERCLLRLLRLPLTWLVRKVQIIYIMSAIWNPALALTLCLPVGTYRLPVSWEL